MDKAKITPCLWFNNNTTEAVAFYTGTFKQSTIGGSVKYGEAAAKVSGQAKGSPMTTLFSIEGLEIMALNGGPHFKFTPALSFFVYCESEKEIDELWKKLSAGGSTRMGLDRYPFAAKYGWCEDRFGLSWQLILEKRKQKIAPALLFTNKQAGKAEAAMSFYTSLFTNSRIERVARDEKNGAVLHARFSLAGQDFVAMESPMPFPFDFNPSLSLIVNCDTQTEIDQLWQGLSADEKAEQCGWLKDKFGVSWQIVPRALADLMQNKEKADRVMQVVLKMKKLEIKTLLQAADS